MVLGGAQDERFNDAIQLEGEKKKLDHIESLGQ